MLKYIKIAVKIIIIINGSNNNFNDYDENYEYDNNHDNSIIDDVQTYKFIARDRNVNAHQFRKLIRYLETIFFHNLHKC